MHKVKHGCLLYYLLTLGEKCTLGLHISLHKLRHDLNEQNDADNAEDVADTVTNGYKALENLCIFHGCNGLLSRGECGGGGKGAGEKTDNHTYKLLALKTANLLADEYAEESGKTAGEDDYKTHHYVALEVSLKIAEELGARNEAYACYEQNKSEVFNDLECVYVIAGKRRLDLIVEETAVNKSHYKHARITKGNTLDGDSAERKSDCNDCKYGEHQKSNTGDGDYSAE